MISPREKRESIIRVYSYPRYFYFYNFTVLDTGNGWSDWSTFGPCDNSCIKTRTRFCMDENDRTKCPNPTSTVLLGWGVDEHKTQCSVAECNG